MSQSQNQSAANSRRYVTIHESDGRGEYGYRWCVRLSVRVDGLRFCLYRRGFRWCGNEGGVQESTSYLTPSEARQAWEEEFAAQHEQSFDEFVAGVRSRVQP